MRYAYRIYLPFAFCGCLVDLARQSPTGDRPTFESKVNLVLVPVVVRDDHDRAIAGLTQGDFEIYDNRKRQDIASFATVHRVVAALTSPSDTQPPPNSSTLRPRTETPHPTAAAPHPRTTRSIVYLFDDLNTRFADVANVRPAAEKHFDKNPAPGDQAAICSVSGNPALDFTTDREKLQSTVSKLRWRTGLGAGMQYLADLIIFTGDKQAFDALTAHTVQCAHVRPELARQIAFAAAQRELAVGAGDTQVLLRTLRRAIRRLSGMPGDRIIVLASPGFFASTPEGAKRMAELLDVAPRSHVVVNTLNVRGVIFAEDAQDVVRRGGSSRRVPPSQFSGGELWNKYRRESARADSDVMRDLAQGTGGIVFRNNNDLRAGFDRVAVAPEFSYVLGFSPAELKFDGSHHALKVRVPGEKHFSVEARRDYYAVQLDDRQSGAVAEIDDILFSRDDMSDIPVVLQAGYTKPLNAEEVKVLLSAKVDLEALQYAKAQGRDVGSMNVIAAIFDSDAGYVSGTAETVNLKLLQEHRGKSRSSPFIGSFRP